MVALESRTLLSAGIIKDINQVDLQPLNLTTGQTALYFTTAVAADGSTQLWETTGASGSTVKAGAIDLATTTDPLAVIGDTAYYLANGPAAGQTSLGSAGPASTSPIALPYAANTLTGITTAGERVFFSLFNPLSGNDELWQSDGTSGGTVETPGFSGSSYVPTIFSAGGKLFFVSEDTPGTFNLYSTDGVTTSLLQSFSGDQPTNFENLNGTLAFNVFNHALNVNQIWTSDGSVAGTSSVNTGSVQPVNSSMALIGGSLYFTGRSASGPAELYNSSGAAGTVELTSGNFSGGFFNLTPVGSELLFVADDGLHGYELWSSNGSASGTRILRDINPGLGDGVLPYASFMTQADRYAPFPVVNGKAFFAADDGVHGLELWMSNGAAAGTAMVKDIDPGADSSSPQNLTVLGGAVLFTAHDGSGADQLWTSDGTASGTQSLASFTPTVNEGSSPGDRVVRNGLVFFEASDGVHNTQVFLSDGTAAATSPIFTPSDGLSLGPIDSLASGIVFSTTSASNAATFYATDGTVLGTQSVWSGQVTKGSIEQEGGLLFWSSPVADPASGKTDFQLWRTDGSAAGTLLLGTFGSATQSVFSYSQIAMTSNAYDFSVNTGSAQELYTTDGSASGTKLVESFGASAWPTSANTFYPDGASLFIVVPNAMQTGQALWTSNGTAAGTFEIKDFSSLGSLGEIVAAGNRLFLLVSGTNGDLALWSSDGTAAGTTLVHDFPGVAGGGGQYQSVNLEQFTASGGLLYFVETDTSLDQSVWRSDGTPGGTIVLHDFGVSPLFQTTGLNDRNGELYFIAEDSQTNAEAVWASDGTIAGTQVVGDVPNSTQAGYAALASPGNVTNFTSNAGRVYFVVNYYDPSNPSGEWSLWDTSGPASGIQKLQGGLPQFGGLNAAGDTLFFGAIDSRGAELWSDSGLYSGNASPPSLDAIGGQSATQAGVVAFTVTTQAPAGDPVFYRATGLPAGSAFSPLTGGFTWDVPLNQPTGMYTPTITAVDAATGLSNSQVVEITINPASAPQISPIANQTADQGKTETFTASGSTLDAGPLVYSIALGGTALGSINPTTGVYVWNVASNQAPGLYSAQVVVTDQATGLTASAPVSLTVYAPPTLPALGPFTVNAGAPLSFSAAAGESDTGSLAYSLAGSPPVGASIDPHSGSITWNVPAGASPGGYALTVQVEDSASQLTISRTYAVSVLAPPTLAPMTAQTIVEGQALSVQAQAHETDSGALRYSLGSNAPAGMTIDPSSGGITWTAPAQGSAGAYSVSVFVTDGASGLNAEQTLSVTVDAPPTSSPPTSPTPPAGSGSGSTHGKHHKAPLKHHKPLVKHHKPVVVKKHHPAAKLHIGRAIAIPQSPQHEHKLTHKAPIAKHDFGFLALGLKARERKLRG